MCHNNYFKNAYLNNVQKKEIISPLFQSFTPFFSASFSNLLDRRQVWKKVPQRLTLLLLKPRSSEPHITRTTNPRSASLWPSQTFPHKQGSFEMRLCLRTSVSIKGWLLDQGGLCEEKHWRATASQWTSPGVRAPTLCAQSYPKVSAHQQESPADF